MSATSSPTPPARVIAWLSPAQVLLVRETADLARFTIISAGGPAQGRSSSVAADLGVPHCPDLRSALNSADADAIWIADPGEFGSDRSGNDARAVLAAHARGVRVIALAPVPASALDLASAGWLTEDSGRRAADVIRTIPSLRHSPAFRQAQDVLVSFGSPRSVLVESWALPSEGTLGACLLSAIDFVSSIMGECETIDASYTPATHGSAASPSGSSQPLRPLPGETLRGLHGDLAAVLRFADGRTATLALSDHAGRFNRTLTLLGQGGRLRIFDDGFEWLSAEGQKLDELRPKRTRGKALDAPHSVAACADAIARLLDPAVPDPGPMNHESVWSMTQAALLSCRTSQPESPATIRRMTGMT